MIFVSAWAPVVLWAGFIFYLSGIPSLSTNLGVWDLILRKAAHVVEYALLTFFLIRAFLKTTQNWTFSRLTGWSCSLAFLYAISDEIHQSFVPGRTAALRDVLFDGCGIIIAMVVLKSKFPNSPSKFIVWVLCAGSLCLPACGPQSQLNRAKKLEQSGKYEAAWLRYQQIAAKNPQSPSAPEALFRAGLMSQRHLNDCYMAGTFYDRVIENHSQSEPWARVAVLQKQNCPDYFPLLIGSQWVEGDSETKGRNARIESVCKLLGDAKSALPSEGGIVEKTYFAGDKKSSTIEFIYKKAQNQLLELKSADDPLGKTVLQWPLQVGQTWKTRVGNTTFVYEIESDKEKVKVEAGEFENCLKVRFVISGISGAATHEYYAPGVGRVLTTVSTKGNEARVTELMSHKIGEWALP